MLANTEELKGFDVYSEDEEIGKIEDYYFDKDYWVTRYLAVDTGNWLVERDVLISPESIDNIDYGNGNIKLNIPTEKIENSPPVIKEEPLLRTKEKDLADYFSWPYYWNGTGSSKPGVSGMVPNNLIREITIKENMNKKSPNSNKDEVKAGLRSVNKMINYDIHAVDGRIGHVEKFILDDDNWLVRYIVVETKNFLPGKKVVLAPEWITDIDWVREEVAFNLKKEEIKNAPEYDPVIPVSELYEKKLYEHYDKEKYWE
ncbi:MAG TPA: PRC-barrel domain-containing protein [Halanaerobiales bacterium]|nr:PRC-barrel domain-containing protein [Halanaerobiales bacterium]